MQPLETTHGRVASSADALRDVASLRALAIQQTTLALAAGIVAALVPSLDPGLRVGLAAAAVAGPLLALASVAERRRIMIDLIADRTAPTSAALGRFAASLITMRSRRHVARWIVRALRASGGSDDPYVLDRVATAAPALAALAHALADERVRVDAPAVAGLVSLLGDGAASPLLNPSVAAGALDSALASVREGFAPADWDLP